MVSFYFDFAEFQCCILKSERSQLFLVSALHIPQTLQNHFRRACVCSTLRYLFLVRLQENFRVFFLWRREHFHTEISSKRVRLKIGISGVKEPLFRATHLNFAIFRSIRVCERSAVTGFT